MSLPISPSPAMIRPGYNYCPSCHLILEFRFFIDPNTYTHNIICNNCITEYNKVALMKNNVNSAVVAKPVEEITVKKRKYTIKEKALLSSVSVIPQSKWINSKERKKTSDVIVAKLIFHRNKFK